MNAATLATLFDGARVMACLVIALAFVRIGRTARDRLYHWFGAAFGLMAVSEVLIGLGLKLGEHASPVYLPRLAAFLMIIWAIVDKNRRARAASDPKA